MEDKQQTCRMIDAYLSIFGSKWNLLIMNELFNSPKRFNELKRALSPITQTVLVRHLKSLEESGYLSLGKGHRSIRLPEKEPSVEVPVIGKVTAGLPILAFEEVTGYVPFASAKAVGRELFALNVRGESMKDIGIYDGDIVICEKTAYAENGDIVVAMIGEEATIKSFYKEDGYYRLQPHNDAFAPIVTEHCHVLGKVISLIREY